MIRMFIPNEILLNLPDSFELITTTDLFGNRLSLKYNNKIFLTDQSFYPKYNILTKNLSFLHSYRVNNIDSRFMIPCNSCNSDVIHMLNNVDDFNTKPTFYYLENLSLFINNELKNYYANSLKLDFWKLPTKLFLPNTSIIYSYNLDDSCLQPYEILLKFANTGAKNITFYDPCYSVNSSLINELINLCSYFEWSYEHDNDYLTISNINTDNFVAYINWCSTYYVPYFINLLSLDYTACPNYNSLSEAFSDIIKES